MALAPTVGGCAAAGAALGVNPVADIGCVSALATAALRAVSSPLINPVLLPKSGSREAMS